MVLLFLSISYTGKLCNIYTMEVKLAVSCPNLKCKLKAHFLGHLYLAFNVTQPAVQCRFLHCRQCSAPSVCHDGV